MYQFGHKLGAESDNLATNLELSLVHVQYRMVSELLPCPMGWPSIALVTYLLTNSLSETPFSPRACIRGVASTRFPGLVMFKLFTFANFVSLSVHEPFVVESTKFFALVCLLWFLQQPPIQQTNKCGAIETGTDLADWTDIAYIEMT